jgi:hypothetical protein
MDGSGRVVGAVSSGGVAAGGKLRALRWGVLVLALVAPPMVTGTMVTGTAAAQQAASVDYDMDDDGLIEVDSLAKLNAIRWDLDGDGLVAAAEQAGYGAAFPDAVPGMGCPFRDHDGDSATPDEAGCAGYELTADLTFDTDGDGDVDRDDEFPNWIPIGSYHSVSPSYDTISLDGVKKKVNSSRSRDCSGVFEGNGHTISKMKVRWSWGPGGLFAELDRQGVIRNLGLVDVDIKNMTSNGKAAGLNMAGALVGSNRGRIERSFAVGGKISGWGLVGGLVGRHSGSGSIKDSYVDVDLSGNNDVGGLVGEVVSSITNSYARGAITTHKDPRVMPVSLSGGTSTVPDISGIGGLAGDKYWDGARDRQLLGHRYQRVSHQRRRRWSCRRHRNSCSAWWSGCRNNW